MNAQETYSIKVLQDNGTYYPFDATILGESEEGEFSFMIHDCYRKPGEKNFRPHDYQIELAAGDFSI